MVEEEKKKKTKPRKRIAAAKLKDLKYGEAYRTTKKFTWSNYDQKMAKVEVPADELLIYRISKSYQQGSELALFVWLESGITICLSATDRSILFVKHMEWEDRHRKLGITEREDDTQKIKVPPKGAFGEDSESDGRESVDS